MSRAKIFRDALCFSLLVFIGLFLVTMLVIIGLGIGVSWRIILAGFLIPIFFSEKMSGHCHPLSRLGSALVVAGLAYVAESLDSDILFVAGTLLTNWIFWCEYISNHPVNRHCYQKERE